jgi:1-acyl-sn-glycerol-3-phosphate acyltransferase
VKEKPFVFPKFRIPIVKYILDRLTDILTKVEIDGIENIPLRGNYMLVCNHLSNADFVIISRVFPDSWPIGAKVIANPVIRFLLRFGYNLIYLEKREEFSYREQAESALRVHDFATSELASGRKVILVFPETTRSRNAQLIKGNSRTIKPALDAGVIILPLALTGTQNLMPITDKRDNILDKTIGRLPRRTPSVKLRIGKPLSFSKDIKREDAFLEVMRAIATLLPEEYRGHYKEIVAEQNTSGSASNV